MNKNERSFSFNFCIAAGIGALIGLLLGFLFSDTLYNWYISGSIDVPWHSEKKPHSPLLGKTLPGPPRTETRNFILNESNALLMQGMDDSGNERWADISGNFYTDDFVSGFSYAANGDSSPKVFIKIEPKGKTLIGRLEARNLKPNFAYQLKLFGDFKYRKSFETIGSVGRWRLPGIGTNYTDKDYQQASEKIKSKTEAYILFDFFVTDAKGNAVREFKLDSCLHVLWKVSSRYTKKPERELLRVVVNADDSKVYSRPKKKPFTEYLWAEIEKGRYSPGQTTFSLPAGTYNAFFILTEESFHSHDRDGGWWATVAEVPVKFTITNQ